MKSRKGFTLVELVVVIAIIGVLAAILVPNLLTYVQKSRLKAANGNAKTAYNVVVSHFVDKEVQGMPKATIVANYCNVDIDCRIPPKKALNSVQEEVHDVLAINGIDSGIVYIGTTKIQNRDAYFTHWSNSDDPETDNEAVVGQYPTAITWDYFKANGCTWGNYMSVT